MLEERWYINVQLDILTTKNRLIVSSRGRKIFTRFEKRANDKKQAWRV